MSSIYRKGRDGYFYYQAYVFNAKSNKKDKRIFHSLGTKDENEAKEKKIDLDKKYEKSISRIKQGSSSFLNFKLSYLKTFFFMISVFTLYKIVGFKNNDVMINLNPNEVMKKDIVISIKDSTMKNSTNNYKVEKTKIFPDTNLKNKEKLNSKIFDYSIQRIEKLSGFFQQGKIYITINPNYSEKSQRELCNRLKGEYTEFPNLIICIYSNDEIGISIAKGTISENNIDIQKKSWLSMYSFNKVEGEYFDNDPTRYLGNI